MWWQYNVDYSISSATHCGMVQFDWYLGFKKQYIFWEAIITHTVVWVFKKKFKSVHEWTSIICVAFVPLPRWSLVFRCLSQTKPLKFFVGSPVSQRPLRLMGCNMWVSEREGVCGYAGMCAVCVCWLAESPWGSTVKLSSVVVSGICCLSLSERGSPGSNSGK